MYIKTGRRNTGRPVGAGDPFPGLKRPGSEVNHIVPKLRMCGAVPLLPLYASMTCTGKALPRKEDVKCLVLRTPR
jgi:hypothetical protein